LGLIAKKIKVFYVNSRAIFSDKISMHDPKAEAREEEDLRRFAFFGVTISTVATITSIILVPMLYNYMQHIHSSLQTEVDFCYHRTNGLWEEYSRVSSNMVRRIEIVKRNYHVSSDWHVGPQEARSAHTQLGPHGATSARRAQLRWRWILGYNDRRTAVDGAAETRQLRPEGNGSAWTPGSAGT
jgi:hypothetical protein